MMLVPVKLRGREVEGVRITDTATELVYTVVPTLDRDVAVLWEYSVRRKRGPLPSPPYRDYLSMPYLATVALEFLDGEHPGATAVVRSEDGRVQIAHGRKRNPPRPDAENAPEPRPDDKWLVHYVNGFIIDGKSPREEFARIYGVSKNTADTWIRRARDLRPDLIPPPTRGRPRVSTTERNDQ